MIWIVIWAAWLMALVRGVDDASSTMAYMYLDNVEFLAATNNIASLPLSRLTAGFAQPNLTDTATFEGYDWTQPYPSFKVDGFQAHIHVAYDVPLTQNSSSAVSALTFSNPSSMMQNATKSKMMDPSWFVCQHLFVSRVTSPSNYNHDCGFLGQQCVADIKSNLTKQWGHFDATVPCSGRVFDLVPKSCQDGFGLARAAIQGWNSEVLQDPSQAELLAVDRVAQYTWKLGTGYRDVGNDMAYQVAANRTFLVATVWGYSADADQNHIKTPEASLVCLRPSNDTSVYDIVG